MVKVEKNENTQTGITMFAFEGQNDADRELIDKLRVALLGDHPIRGGYVNGNRLVIETRVPVKNFDDVAKA